ncbi:hypothetical protein [Arthrobacter sp. KNU40]|uniref:hypothetical protein n=1 Tax=Arthrobacter sp. KNU40 TaxID=3447965 RepID=UPI003F636A5F
MPDILIGQERIVVPKMAAARERLVALDELDPLVQDLVRLGPNLIKVHWNHLVLAEQRQVIGALVLPFVQPVTASNRGRRGVDTKRVDLVWR